jgi:hypothetical protein
MRLVAVDWVVGLGAADGAMADRMSACRQDGKISLLFTRLAPSLMTAPLTASRLPADAMDERGPDAARVRPGAIPAICSMDHSAGTFIFDSQDPLRVYASCEARRKAFAHKVGESLRVSGH